MKYNIIFFVLFITNFTMAQNKTAQVEIEPYFRWDTYPQFINAINSVATYKLDIKGKSWGINAAYKISLKNNLLIKFGLGFFEYSFTDIESTHSSFGKGNERVIDYPTTLGIILATDKYWYNTASLNIGVEKLFELKNNLLITTRINLKNYFTFSQQYHIPTDNSFIPPALKIENDYKTDINRYFGFGSEFQIGLLKKIGKINVGPSLIVPIYDTWKQDNIFPTEINSNNRNKWLRGFGFGIICNYSITKINNHAK